MEINVERITESDNIGSIPVLDIDPFSDEVLLDPYPFFERLRDAGEVVMLKPYGIYAVGRHDQVQKVLSDWPNFTNSGGAGLSDIRKPDSWRPASAILESDPPEHTRIRAALMKTISPIVIRGWKTLFEKEAEILVEKIIDLRTFDGVRDIAEAYVMKVFPQGIGIEIPRDNAIAIGDMNFNAIGPANSRTQEATKRAEPYMAWYEKSLLRESMKPGGVGERIFQAEDAGEIAPGVGANLTRSFLRGGMDTTIAGIGHTLNALSRDPAAWHACHVSPSKVAGAFEESLRFESPTQVMFRTTVGDTVAFGQRLNGDTKIAAFIGAANRDPRKWVEPDRYDISRQVTGTHLAFGAGPHVCIGQMIARLEAQCILGALARRVKTLTQTGKPEYRLINTMRTLDRLPLHVTPL